MSCVAPRLSPTGTGISTDADRCEDVHLIIPERANVALKVPVL